MTELIPAVTGLGVLALLAGSNSHLASDHKEVVSVGVAGTLMLLYVAALIFMQKTLPYGDRLTRVFAVAFVAAGVWIAIAPGSVPGLTQPDSHAADQARMRMMHLQPRMQQVGPEKKSPTDMGSNGDSGSMTP